MSKKAFVFNKGRWAVHEGRLGWFGGNQLWLSADPMEANKARREVRIRARLVYLDALIRRFGWKLPR